MSAIGIFAYLKGHRDGVTQADVRSLSYEIPIFDDLGKSGPEDPKAKLGHLIAFRHGWLNSELSLWESWSYWGQVDANAVLNTTRNRVREIASQFPSTTAAPGKKPSEHVVGGNGG